MRRMILASAVLLMAAACLPPAAGSPSPSSGAGTAGNPATVTPATQTGSGSTPSAPSQQPTPPPAQPNTTPTPTERPISGGVGDTLTTTLWSLTLEKIERPGKALEWSNPDGKLEAKGEFLLATLQVKGLAPKAASLTRQSFVLNSKVGDGYNPLNCCIPYLTARGVRALLPITEFQPGDGGKITLVFDVDPKDSSFVLVYVDSKGMFWRLP